MKELGIKSKDASSARDYVYPATEVAKYHGVGHGAVLDSRAYAKDQIEKQKRYDAKGKILISDKLDKLYAYHQAMKASKDIQTVSGEDAKKLIEDEGKYEIRRVG